MKNIKVIEGLEPWEVMRRASEGEAVALWLTASKQWVEAAKCGALAWKDKVAIIDTSAPELSDEDWRKFDWPFFGRLGGVWAKYDRGPFLLKTYKDVREGLGLAESPLYYWPGGECPVPDNVEVEVVFRLPIRGETTTVTNASFFDWERNRQDGGDIIAFKLTGRVL